MEAIEKKGKKTIKKVAKKDKLETAEKKISPAGMMMRSGKKFIEIIDMRAVLK